MMELKIRPYRREDEPDVIDLWSRCGLVVPWNNPARDIERKLKVNPDWFLVGESQGRLIATCMVGYEGHRGWINYLAVDPAYRRRSFACRMMQAAERLLEKTGCPKINLLVRTSNTRVIDFYKALGFKMDDAVCLGKRLEKD